MHWLEQFKSILSEVGFAGLADIAIVALVFYVFLVALKRTRRSGLILAGILIASAVYVLALKLDLLLTVTLLHGFFTVILVALVVIFQEDLRYVLRARRPVVGATPVALLQAARWTPAAPRGGDSQPHAGRPGTGKDWRAGGLAGRGCDQPPSRRG